MRDGERRCSLRGTRLSRLRNKLNTMMRDRELRRRTVVVVVVGVVAMGSVVGWWGVPTKIPVANSVISEGVNKTAFTAEHTKKEVVLSSKEPILKSYEEIATEIMQGKWGNGEERFNKLRSAGYTTQQIKEIQAIVDNKSDKISKTNTTTAVKSSKVEQGKPQNTQTTNTTSTVVKTQIPTTQVATRVWNCMKAYGWSDIVCAGIMGNLMAEVGGQTFNLNPNSSGGCGYGLCQWTGGRRALLLSTYGSSPSVEQQIEYMRRELLGIGVKRQVTEAGYNSIMSARSPEECALRFAKLFERCGAAFQKRQQNARKAYEAFS